jgi:hypothetical protein
MNSEYITFQLPSILLREKRFLLVAQPARKDRARETGNLQLLRLHLSFLGFTFLWGQSRRGNFLLKRKSQRDRMKAKLQEVKGELRRRRHQPIPEQGRWLRQVVTGFFAYHAVPTNSRALGAFRLHTARLWRRVLRRRSQKDGFTWKRIEKLAAEDMLSRITRRHDGLAEWPDSSIIGNIERLRAQE